MRVIKLKKFKIDDRELTYKTLISNVLNTSPTNQQGQPTGFSPSEMKERVRVLDILEDAEDELVLEDSDHRVLTSALKGFKWGFVHGRLIDFVEEIEEAEPVSVEDVRGDKDEQE